LVSLGCGPASYELWLLHRRMVRRITLVDHSPTMLARAMAIATQLGIAGRVTIICADASNSGLRTVSADVVFSINAMHWSAGWQRWIVEAARIAKFGAPVFISCTMGLPRSGITADNLAMATRGQFGVNDYGFVTPPQTVAGGMAAISFRFYVSGKKPSQFAAQRAKQRR
jgi:ubiquinone/menaquinone biosynthesis C-methylase UbiE